MFLPFIFGLLTPPSEGGGIAASRQTSQCSLRQAAGLRAACLAKAATELHADIGACWRRSMRIRQQDFDFPHWKQQGAQAVPGQRRCRPYEVGQAQAHPGDVVDLAVFGLQDQRP